jgi:hypothetical protein
MKHTVLSIYANICQITFLSKMVLNKENVLLPLFMNFALQCVIRKVQLSQMGLKLNGTHQLLAYADDVNLLG